MKTGDFTLSSGRKSDLYFDIKGLLMDPHPAATLHIEFITFIQESIGGKYATFVGMELGGAQLVQFLVARGWHGAIVRKNQKKYGLKDRIIRSKASYEDVVIVDDVITSGNTVNEVAELFPAPQVLGVFCIIDRSEKQDYNSLFKEDDFK